MYYHSTRDSSCRVTAAEAIARGISAEGGLFVPEKLPELTAEKLQSMAGMTYAEKAKAVLGEFLTDFTPAELADCIDQAYAPEKFDSENIAEIAKVGERDYLLELWHGPTCAFKDMALQLLPHLLTVSAAKTEPGKEIVVLVATSGDTGKAALEGFKDVPGTRMLVFYPENGVSRMQKRQMTTQEGGNVSVCAIKGNFDDAQTGVKKIFTDPAILAKLAENGQKFSSANSINWGRLAPQIVYYFAAYAQLLKAGKIAFGDEVDFCVPTGNFGDILAGYYAKRMGLPVGRLVCASNQNNVLTDFLRTGVYTARRAFYKTSSPSMDILVSSNLERLLWHVTGSDAEVAGLMDRLNREGSYTVRPETLAAIQGTFACGWSSEEEVAAEIRTRWERDGYLCDTHTAVAFHVAGQHKREGVPMVVLSTASPFKFPRSVLAALGHAAPENDFEAMQALEQATGRTAPASLAGLRQKPERFDAVIDPSQIAEVALGYQA